MVVPDPWIAVLGKHAERHRRQREWNLKRLRLLEGSPGAVIHEWKRWDDAISFHDRYEARYPREGKDDYEYVPPALDLGRSCVLPPAYRYTVWGQLALESGYSPWESQAERNQLAAYHKEKLRLYRELMACVVCHKCNPLRDVWICRACHRQWVRQEKPRDRDYGLFARERRVHNYYSALTCGDKGRKLQWVYRECTDDQISNHLSERVS